MKEERAKSSRTDTASSARTISIPPALLMMPGISSTPKMEL
jgi:hypothetical protein